MYELPVIIERENAFNYLMSEKCPALRSKEVMRHLLIPKCIKNPLWNGLASASSLKYLSLLS
jgi:hypothetical protein